jgi:hypothetical protein
MILRRRRRRRRHDIRFRFVLFFDWCWKVSCVGDGRWVRVVGVSRRS